tara:strand:- start:1363 stop:1704 length:342 start_codon:yes stop_codon:yes gene_type:complete
MMQVVHSSHLTKNFPTRAHLLTHITITFFTGVAVPWYGGDAAASNGSTARMGSSLQSHRTDGGAKRKTICIKEEKKEKKLEQIVLKIFSISRFQKIVHKSPKGGLKCDECSIS